MTIKYKNSKSFYDAFGNKLIKDYLQGNLRMEAAIQFALSRITIEDKSILDIGCGIGWSSNEIANMLPKSKVLAVDLSNNSILIAKELFKRKNLKFSTEDITQYKFKGTIDTILLIDVYEHILKEDRNKLHSQIKSLLTDSGSILLTCPTIKHQNYLRKNKPSGLQPVDEDVSKNNLKKFATDIGGKLTYFKEVDIWSEGDYFHAQIEKFSPKIITSPHQITLETTKKRYKRVKNSNIYKNLTPEIKKQINSSIGEKIKRFFSKYA